MSELRIEIDCGKIRANAQVLVERCERRGISVTAVTKAMLGAPEVANALDVASRLGDSRIENIERIRSLGIDTPALLLRSPMLSQVQRIVTADVMSVNTEVDVLSALSSAAQALGRTHDVMLMVELGDLREGLMPAALNEAVQHVLALQNLRLSGIGANLACRSGAAPSDENMGELSAIVETVEATFGIDIGIVSGGNSANLDWALGATSVGRINNLRLGESILLGREPLRRRPIAGLHTDAITIVAEVIESQRKPTKPWGAVNQNAFGESLQAEDRGEIWQTILALGRQDIDPADLQVHGCVEILAASSDHLVAATSHRMKPGDEIRFEPGYSALLRSMTSPFVAKHFTSVV